MDGGWFSSLCACASHHWFQKYGGLSWRANTEGFRKRRKRRQERLPQDYKRLPRRDKCWKKTEMTLDWNTKQVCWYIVCWDRCFRRRPLSSDLNKFHYKILMFSFNIEMNLTKKKTFIIFVVMKMEYFIFKVEEKKDGREYRNLFGTGSLYKSWQCFRRMCAFSLFKNKGML